MAAYTTIDKPSDYFETVLYTGDGGSSRGVTGVGFQPDWVWIKNRDQGNSHHIYDVIRGTTKRLASNNTNAEETVSNGLTAFGSDGFTVGNSGAVNGSSEKLVSWNWKAGTSFTNDASATGIGTIDSTGSVNTDAGFSIISYTGTGSAGTVAHGLGSELACYIIKQRNTTGGWIVYHKGNTSSPQTDYLRLDKTDATVDDAIFNDTAPTSSVFSIGTNAPVNTSGGTYIAYCFAEKQGYSKFGSYTGNGSTDGVFNFLGFKPAFVMVKRTDSTANWQILDNKRNTYNPWNTALFPDTSEPDTTDYSTDHLSNGFKLRVTTTSRNGSGASYIYMAFAENPFVSSTGVPACAR